jgi:hypothetical protein
MSVEGFVASLKRRRAEISAEIDRMTVANEGVLPKRETQKLRQERDRIDDAIYRAERRGIAECTA